MSKYTLVRRAAFVAIASLGVGLMPAATSNAAVSADTVTLGSATSTGTVGTVATNTVTVSFIAGLVNDSMTVSAILLSAPAAASAASNLPAFSMTPSQSATAVNADTVTTVTGASATAKANSAAGRSTVAFTLSVTPDAAGDYVYRITPGGGAINTAALTWTLTVAAKPAITAAASSSILNLASTTANISDSAVLVAATAASGAGSQAGTIVVQARNGVETLTATTVLSVSISGPGTLAIGTNAATLVPTGRSLTGTAGQNIIGVFADGTAGKATITIAAGTTTLATEEVTFFGTTASIAVDTTTIAANVGVGENDTITFTALDANGNKTGLDLANGASSDTTVATVTVAAGVATVVGVKPGTATIQVCSLSCTSTSASLVKSAPVTVTVRPVATGNAFKVTMSLDKATYLPGEKMTLTVSAVDTSTPAVALADGARNLFTASGVTATGGISGALPTQSVTLVSGSKTYTLYAPLGGGTVMFSGTDATTAGGTVSASAVVSNPAQDAADAATDAALEAIDAANAATDAANLAAEAADAATVAAEEARDAADAATAAVEALAAEVSTMISEIKAQLTALANVVAKIAKKVKA